MPTLDLDTDEPSTAGQVPVDTAQPAEALIVPISSSLQDWAQMAGEDFAHYAPPPSFWGAVENLGWPTGLASIALTVDQSDTLTHHGFAEVVHATENITTDAVAYHDSLSGLTYAPTLDQIGDPDAQDPLDRVGETDDQGITRYESPDGSVVRYVRTTVACPEGMTCLQAISFHPDTPGALVWLQMDNDGEIAGYMPAVSDVYPEDATAWQSAEGKWESSLTGPTALLVGKGWGRYYGELAGQEGEGNVLIFDADGAERQASDEELRYTPSSDTLWAETEAGLFVFDADTTEWGEATRVEGSVALYQMGGEHFVLVDGQLLWAEEIINPDGETQIITKDGQTLVWDGDEWGVGRETAEVGSVLSNLDLNQEDHANFDPANYRVGSVADLSATDKAIDWLSTDTPVLINTNPITGEQRVDATFVDTNGDGTPEWVRGLYYPVEGYGGMAVDVIVHPQQDQRAFFAEPGSAQAVYGELLTAIAHQLGMSVESLQNQVAGGDTTVEIRLPEFSNPDNHSKNRSPSYLQASDPVSVDLSKPVVYATRSGTYIDQEVAPGVTVPDGIRWVVGDSDAGIAVFVANEQLFIVYESDGNMTTDHPDSVAARMFRALDMIARMQAGFVDTRGEGKSILETTGKVSGKFYYDGATVVNRDVFFTTNPEFTAYETIVFELK